MGYVFTFGHGQPLAGHCVRVDGDYGEARAKMCDVYGTQWGFQYAEEVWDAWKQDPERAWYMETEVPFGTWCINAEQMGQIEDEYGSAVVRKIREMCE